MLLIWYYINNHKNSILKIGFFIYRTTISILGSQANLHVELICFILFLSFTLLKVFENFSTFHTFLKQHFIGKSYGEKNIKCCWMIMIMSSTKLFWTCVCPFFHLIHLSSKFFTSFPEPGANVKYAWFKTSQSEGNYQFYWWERPWMMHVY